MSQGKTAAIDFLEKNGVEYKTLSYDYVSQPGKIGLLAAQKLNIAPDGLLKTIMIDLDKGKHVLCAMIPVDDKIDFKKIRHIESAKKACMLSPEKAESLTGYQCGGISPLGMRTTVPVVFDRSIEKHDHICFNGGHRGLVVDVNTSRVIEILTASVADIVKE